MRTKILVLASNPQDTEKLRLDQESRAIQDALVRGKKRDKFVFQQRWAVRVKDLQSTILEEEPRIVHFCGHGTGNRGLVLETESGQTQLVNTQAIGDLFKLFDNQVEGVVLNACYSEAQASVINQHINYVVGTKKSIRDDAAIAFTKGFYLALFNGESIERAYEFGCNRIQLEIYKNEHPKRTLVPVYSEEESKRLELPQHEVIKLLKKEPLTEFPDAKSEFTPKITVPNNTPLSSANFVGREQELEELKKLDRTLELNSTTKATFISGIGGVGKTELAIQYAQRYKDDYPGGICWLEQRNKDDQNDIGTQIVQFAKTYLKLDPKGDVVSNQVDYCWQNWHIEGDVLVVVDNVTKYDDIKDYLKIPIREGRFKVLVIMLERFSSQKILTDPLEPLKLESALKMLKGIIGEELVKQEEDEAKELCQILGRLPLGLELVGRFIVEEEDISLQEVKELLNEYDSDILREAKDGMTADLGVYAAFDLSWKRLNNDDSAFLGCLFSLFSQAPIPWFLVEELIKKIIVLSLYKDTKPQKFKRFALKPLRKLSLINLCNKEEKTYRVHEIIRRFLEKKLDELPEVEPIRQQFFQVMLKEAKDIPNNPIKQDLEAVRLSIPHIIKAGQDRKKWLENQDKDLTAEYKDLVDIYIGLGRFYQGESYYDLAEEHYKEGLSIAEEHLDEFHPYVLETQNALAYVYVLHQSLDNAEPLYREAEKRGAERLKTLENTVPNKMSEEVQKKIRLSVARSQDGLGYLLCRRFYQQQANFTDISNCEFKKKEETESLLNTALETRRKLLESDHLDIATSLNHLAFFHRSQQHWKESEPLYVQALEMRQRLNKQDSPALAESLHNTATYYHDWGNQLNECARCYLHWENRDDFSVKAYRHFQRSLIVFLSFLILAFSIFIQLLTFFTQEMIGETEPQVEVFVVRNLFFLCFSVQL